MKACERGTFFQLKVYERSTISVKMVYRGTKGLCLVEEPSRTLSSTSTVAVFWAGRGMLS